MQKGFSTPTLLLAGIVLTLLVLAGVHLLPARKLELISPQFGSSTYLISSDGTQNNPAVQWLDFKQVRMHCRYAEAHSYMGCGVALTVGGEDGNPAQGRDLSGFDSIELDMVYQGPSPAVRVALRNFNPRFSKASDPNSARFQSTILRPRDVSVPVEVELSELTVAEWWKRLYDLPREFNQPTVENVNTVLIDLPYVQPGEDHEIQLRNITFKGQWVRRDHAYLAVLCAWLIGATVMVVSGWTQLRRSHNQQQREIDALTARTSQLRTEQEKLQRLATIDELTGVLNRRGLEQALQDYEEAARGMTVVMLDIDHFKRVNDRLGHDSGDEVLKRVAAVVAANLRASDVLGRFGGEEFVIATQGTRVRDAARLAEKLREHVEHSEINCGGVRINVTASFGVALAPPGGSAAEALKRADDALYRAKDRGRNRVELDNAVAVDSASATLM